MTTTESEIRRDERCKTAEAIARAIEIAEGWRCPTCGGEPAAYAEFDTGQKQRSCKAGHRWPVPPTHQPAAQIARDHGRLCCDLHNTNCEPPSELCCNHCTEATHPQHPRGVACMLDSAAERA